MIVTLNPNGTSLAVVGAVAAVVAESLGGRKQGYTPYFFWVSENTTKEDIAVALKNALRKRRLSEDAITIAKVD